MIRSDTTDLPAAVPMDDATLLRGVTPAALAAGRRYAEEGRVVTLIASPDGHSLRARTRGSLARPYRQEIALRPDGQGGMSFAGQCTCPVGFNCKHVAAVLIAARAGAPVGRADAWLDPLAQALAAVATPDEDTERTRPRLLYLLQPTPAADGTLALQIVPFATILRRDGAIEASRPLAPGLWRTPPGYLGAADLLILRGLDGTPPEGFPALLRQVIATGRARWEMLTGPAASEGPPRPGRITPPEEGSGLLLAEPNLLALQLPEPWYADPATAVLGPVALEAQAEAAQTLQGPPRPRLRLYLGDLPFDPERRRAQRRFAPSGLFPAPLGRLSFLYGPLDLPFSRAPAAANLAQDGITYRVLRDLRGEHSALARLGGIGFARVGEAFKTYFAHAHSDDFLLEDDQDGTDWATVMLEEIPALRADGWEVEVDEAFPYRMVEAEGPPVAALVEATGIDWLELHLGATVDGQHVDLVPALVRMIANGSLAGLLDEGEDAPMGPPILVPLPDGRKLSLPLAQIRPTLLALLELAEGGHFDPSSGRVGFARHDAADLALLEAASGIEWQGGESLRLLGRQLRAAGGAIPPVSLPDSFRGTLRPYQAQGVAWLQFLRAAGLGGVLADDMGLGKTVQTLAHLAIEQAAGRLTRPALIVCPTSLIPNWTMEAARFAPGLRLLALHGPTRKQHFDAIGAHDLVLTTYPLLPRDHEVLTAQDWHAVILDEAQTIKNPNAAATRQTLKLRAGQRICLSGTPLQNHLGELWSLFDFLAPGFLGDARAFRTHYRTPIEKHGDAERHALLVRRVRPFLLRRTKDEVATELPPKTEITEPVELGPIQRAIYEGIRLSMHARVQAAIAEQGLARSGIVILDALLKLRQACCDPRLLKLKAAQQARAGSAKLERLMELLEVLLGEGRRVLLFSQFTSMLALIEQRLLSAGIDYVQLTGDTRDRATPVRRFQAGEVPVFLISLKAGGVGLNLTAADTVIHYDPWWNPAVEDQATDRAHRIGQDKRVFVHRLITLGSIEEKMESLKQRKRALVGSILDSGQGGALQLTESDIEALFAPA